MIKNVRGFFFFRVCSVNFTLSCHAKAVMESRDSNQNIIPCDALTVNK